MNDKRAAAFRAGSNLTPELAKNRQTVLEEASRPLSGPAAPRLAAPTAVPSNASTSYTGNNVIMLKNGEKEVRVVLPLLLRSWFSLLLAFFFHIVHKRSWQIHRSNAQARNEC